MLATGPIVPDAAFYAVAAAAEKWGWAESATDWREVIARDDIDIVDIVTPGDSHAEIAYELPNAHVGYQLGYGVVADFQPTGVSTNYRLRVIIMAAVKDDLALIAVAEGPFRRFTPDFGPGPPSGANLEIAMDMAKYVESFSWKGDPVR